MKFVAAVIFGTILYIAETNNRHLEIVSNLSEDN